MKLTVASSPHIRGNFRTNRIMLDVVLSLLPALAVGVWVLGLRALMVALISVASAVAAEWFDVSFNESEDNKVTLNLSKDDTQIECILEMKINQFGNVTYTILENGGLAFDHAKILATAFRIMRNQKDEYELVFRFLPKKFTLSSMQRVYEIINNIFDQPANFRRKAANYVVETDEYEDCIGHRPAKLYERKL